MHHEVNPALTKVLAEGHPTHSAKVGFFKNVLMLFSRKSCTAGLKGPLLLSNNNNDVF